MTEITGRHWTWAVIVAVLAHAALVGVFYEKPVSTAKQVGLSGIEISLGPAGGVAGDNVEEAPAEPPPKPVESEPEPEPEPVAQAPKPKPEPKPRKIEKPRPKKVVTPKPQPKPAKPVEREVVETAPATTIAGTIGKSGAKVAPNSGNQDNSPGGGVPGPKPDYIALLQAWLERHKEYPRRARLRRQEGTVMLSFTMNREGSVLDY